MPYMSPTLYLCIWCARRTLYGSLLVRYACTEVLYKLPSLTQRPLQWTRPMGSCSLDPRVASVLSFLPFDTILAHHIVNFYCNAHPWFAWTKPQPCTSISLDLAEANSTDWLCHLSHFPAEGEVRGKMVPRFNASYH